ncbi:MAG: BNR-4 repeat-containing protein, partial [Verrucomicrobia bacterium]|nr:BNR-4 repeat-containing protein [Verrucomicrobiota bacterium]
MKKLLMLALLVGFAQTGYAAPQADYKIVEKIAVQPVWGATPVAFALETVGERQFIAFYDADRQMVVGQRTLDSKDWTFQKLPSFLVWDSHNYIEMAIDSEGYIHISGNMHVVPLVYFRSEKPYDVTSLKEINRMTGELET